jgi:ADP-ribose pyrophosphatase
MDKPILPHEIKKIFEGRVFSVLVETITLPKGQAMNAEIVRHPPSVVILPITAGGDVILVRQYRHPIGRWMWELPAGSLDPGEIAEQAAIRECHEEINLVPGKVERVGAFFPTPGYCDEEMIIVKATELRTPRPDESAHADEDEDIEPKAFAVEDLRRMIAGGEIVDLKTVAGVFLLSVRGPES